MLAGAVSEPRAVVVPVFAVVPDAVVVTPNALVELRVLHGVSLRARKAQRSLVAHVVTPVSVPLLAESDAVDDVLDAELEVVERASSMAKLPNDV